MSKVIAVIVTVLAGFLGTVLLGGWLNFPDAGAIFAIAAMGFFILRELEKRK